MSEAAAQALVEEATALAAQGEAHFEAAFDKVEAALRLDPQNVDGWSLKGLLLDWVEHYAEAFLCHSRAAELDPDSLQILVNLGDNSTFRKDYEEAFGYYGQVESQLEILASEGVDDEQQWAELAERRIQAQLDWAAADDTPLEQAKALRKDAAGFVARLRARFPLNAALAVLHGQVLEQTPADLPGD